MDDVEVDGARNDSGNDGVVVNLLMKISGIASGKLHRSEIIDIHIVKVGVDMVAQLEVEVGVHDIADPAVDIVPIDIAPCYWNAVHGYNIGEACGPHRRSGLGRHNVMSTSPCACSPSDIPKLAVASPP